jgi:hypothetical protein
MVRRLACAAVAVLGLALTPVALADGGPSPGTVWGEGVLAAGGNVRYVALPTDNDTFIGTVRTSDGVIVHSTSYAGSWGIPYVTNGGDVGGLSADGRTLVLTRTLQCCGLRSETSFLVLRAPSFKLREIVDLKGDYAFDALSPNGSKLYLIRHVSDRDLTKYVVRAYDLDAHRLLPRVIADRTQRGWVMAGWPVSRATSADGRWVYTLYQRNGAYPFVHALDSVRGVAHCIGIPWTGSDTAAWNMRLGMKNGGRTLTVHWRSGRSYLNMDTRTWRLSPAGGGFPWWWIPIAALVAAALLFVTRRTLRRARRSAPVLAAGGSGRMPALHDARPESG